MGMPCCPKVSNINMNMTVTALPFGKQSNHHQKPFENFRLTTTIYVVEKWVEIA